MPEPEAIPAQATPVQSTRSGAIAPIWHTLLLVGLLLLFSLGGSHSQPQIVQRYGRMPLYISTIIYEWALVAFIWVGIRARRVRLRELIGGRWKTPEDAVMDVAVAIGFWMVAIFLVVAPLKLAMGLSSLQTSQTARQIKEAKDMFGFLIPSGGWEDFAFLLLTLSAGFCEEVIYRGYLQRQLSAVSRSAGVGITLQAILFGASHGYQGIRYMAVIAALGAMFGLLARWRKSLRPGMIAHTGQDLVSGIALKMLSRM